MTITTEIASLIIKAFKEVNLRSVTKVITPPQVVAAALSLYLPRMTPVAGHLAGQV